ncbi:putative DMT superfamily transporter inner membrane protein [Clostridium acetireducens DSM 10703]|uniref:Putative DMT superfamily transporter inner membrane protein n=1 Tax=Clostridium acetireducens DSM 10703 TaxID=1121290 RepID=A0A1E8EXH8_9CLOT|nr:EamA family transporter [Clostridium acetireducens]OFI05238.1 putative DMT superfamily transporter inner membrane protein [Clostridium acetireducens DSM 10703]
MKKGYLYVVITAFIFSTMEIGGKIISNEINPFQLTFLRFLIGGLFLLPFAIKEFKKRNLKLEKYDFFYFMLTGALCVIVSMGFFQLAIVYTKASVVAIVFSTNPMFTIPFAYFILKENLTKSTIISLVLSFIGIICILNPFNITLDIKGIIFAILAALTFSLYSVIGKMKIEKYGGIIMNCFTFLVGDIILFIGILLFKIPVISGVSSSNIIHIIYLGIVVTGLGYLFYFFAMEETSASTASIVFFIKPALAPILSLIILAENIPFNTLLGIVFILLGSFVTLKGKKNKEAHE